MTFMQNLANNPSGGIYDSGNRASSTGDTLDIVNRLKDREKRDFMDKANFMSDLSLKQERLRSMYNPDTSQGVMGGYSGPSGQQGQNAPSQGMNTVMAHDPSQMTAFQKGELGVRQQGMNLESQRLAQSGRMGEERLGIQRSQEKLNEEKNKGIHEQKQADMQRKIEDSTKKFELAQAEL